MGNLYEQLDQIFHQPRRLEIMAELVADQRGRTFNELKDSCQLTDGNLSRHLQSLEEAGAIKIKKSFADSKPLTSVQATSKGREQFVQYLEALENVLQDAATRIKGIKGSEKKLTGFQRVGKLVRS